MTAKVSVTRSSGCARLAQRQGRRHREGESLCGQGSTGIKAMQANARMNRVIRDKPGGLVVDLKEQAVRPCSHRRICCVRSGFIDASLKVHVVSR